MSTEQKPQIRLVMPAQAELLRDFADREPIVDWLLDTFIDGNARLSAAGLDLAYTVATEPERIRAAAEEAWNAACDYLASRNWKDMTHAEYTSALLKAWNANPYRDAESTDNNIAWLLPERAALLSRIKAVEGDTGVSFDGLVSRIKDAERAGAVYALRRAAVVADSSATYDWLNERANAIANGADW